MAQTLQTLSTISFAVAAGCFVLAVFFWFFFKIPTVVGDLSGRTAKKSIARMRAVNEKSGVKSHKSSKTNVERGKLTATMPGMREPEKKHPTASKTEKPETGLLSENKAVKVESPETVVLDQATELLESEATGLLVNPNATPAASASPRPIARTCGRKLEMLEEVMYTHTNERIE